ncbi:vera protein [Xylaria sp. FL1042]|nr:vera protein [Xylaria sp. FL1042]
MHFPNHDNCYILIKFGLRHVSILLIFFFLFGGPCYIYFSIMQGVATLQILLWLAGLAVACALIQFLYTGFVCRRRTRRLVSSGISIAHHSMLFGHIPILIDFKRSNPPDVNISVLHTWLATNYIKYFNGVSQLPPVVYLDLWPVAPSFALVYDASAIMQFTQSRSLPKLHELTEYIRPLTFGRDIVSTEGQEWKTWRARFNRGFNSRNIIRLLPGIIDDVQAFADNINTMTGKIGDPRTWGPVFQLREKAADLTLDVICRVTLDMQLQQQSCSSNTLLKTILNDQVRLMNLLNDSGGFIRRYIPWHRNMIVRNNRVLDSIIRPFIDRLVMAEAVNSTEGTNSAVEAAIQHTLVVHHNKGSQSSTEWEDIADIITSNVKAFLFAGEDTTASTICFMFKCLQDCPSALARLRAEHDEALGGVPSEAASILRRNPQLLYNLPYTLGVIKETLRLYPLASTARQSPSEFDLIIMDDITGLEQYYPLKGFAPWVAAGGVHQSPKYWPRSSEFLPERWLMTDKSDPLYPCKEAWIPFSSGPRNCIGMELALAQLRLVCVLVARSLDIKEAWDEWDEINGRRVTPVEKICGQRLYAVGAGPVHPKDGMPVQVRVRSL